MSGFLTMDKLLLTLTGQAMNYAVRSGIRVTGQYAITQVSRLMRKSSNIDDIHRSELRVLQERLQGKIRIISPAIDMIELIAARGNSSLESAVCLTKGIRWDIQRLGQRLATLASNDDLNRRGGLSTSRRVQFNAEIQSIIKEIREVLDRIEDAVPLINLAITTSGASLSTTLPTTVSPSRLLQASTFLTAGDTQYSVSSAHAVQIGPTFTLSVYLLFAGHVRPHDEESIRDTTWKEVIHKARLKLRRLPMVSLDSHTSRPSKYSESKHANDSLKSDEFAYQLLIIEDLEDDRVHTFEPPEEEPSRFEDVALAGIREVIPIHQISKIFYADTGKILNIGSEGETNHPVLLLKRDVNAVPPRRMLDRREVEFNELDEESSDGTLEGDEYAEANDAASVPPTEPTTVEDHRWRFPPGLDLEWIAFEVYTEPESSDSEDEMDSTGPSPGPRNTGNNLNSQFSELSIEDQGDTTRPLREASASRPPPEVGSLFTVSNPLFQNIRTSLSLLEMLLRLTSLQQFQQQSHLSIPDELLNFFLEESSTTGAGGDEHHRQQVRSEARRKVGWDPYDESPLKRRGEEYQYGTDQEYESWADSPSGRRANTVAYSSNTTPRSRGYPVGEEIPRDGSRRSVGMRVSSASPSPSHRPGVKVKNSGTRKDRPGRLSFQEESSPLGRIARSHNQE